MDGASIVFLAFTASWCGPCVEFKRDFADVQCIDIAEPENKEIVEEYRVAGTPTIVAVDEDGKEVARTFGYHGKRRMQRWMDAVRERRP